MNQQPRYIKMTCFKCKEHAVYVRQVYNSRITNWELCEVPICDECRKAEDLSEKMIEYKERQKPKKYKVINMVRCCSECDSQIKVCYKFCPYCGQAIDWSK